MSALKQALRIAGLTGLAITGYAAYSHYAIRRFENLDPLNAHAQPAGHYIPIDSSQRARKSGCVRAITTVQPLTESTRFSLSMAV